MRALAMALLALCVVAPAAAQPKPAAARLAGEWAFETEEYNYGCRLKGTVVIEPPSRRGVSACRLVAFESCPDLEARADQTCVVTRQGADGVRITSRVSRVTPDDLAGGYAPDDFELRVIDPTLMEGELRSFAIAPAKFYRPQSVPIS